MAKDLDQTCSKQQIWITCSMLQVWISFGSQQCWITFSIQQIWISCRMLKVWIYLGSQQIRITSSVQRIWITCSMQKIAATHSLVAVHFTHWAGTSAAMSAGLAAAAVARSRPPTTVRASRAGA